MLSEIDIAGICLCYEAGTNFQAVKHAFYHTVNYTAKRLANYDAREMLICGIGGSFIGAFMGGSLESCVRGISSNSPINDPWYIIIGTLAGAVGGIKLGLRKNQLKNQPENTNNC